MSNFQKADCSDEYLNYSADERQAKMAAMMARMKKPEYQREVESTAFMERIDEVNAKIQYWKTRDDTTATDAEIVQRNLEPLEAELSSIQKKAIQIREGSPGAPEESLLPARPAADGDKPEPSLPTKDIATCFDGLNGWNAKRWHKNLGGSNWLHPARTARGAAGGAPSTWNPLALAQLVHDKTKGQRPREQILKEFNNRFNTNPVLEPWKTNFNEYFAIFSESD